MKENILKQYIDEEITNFYISSIKEALGIHDNQ
jgi:hypothetical protein